MNENRFMVRVYGIILNNKKEVLVSDEYFQETSMTKFPGGGLEFGEGTVDCLKREIMEECGQAIEILEHFYTTDFYQKALFYQHTQLISIYYLARFIDPVQFKISEIPFDFPPGINDSQSFRWVSIQNLKPEDFTFPIDKHVVELLKSNKLNKLV